MRLPILPPFPISHRYDVPYVSEDTADANCWMHNEWLLEQSDDDNTPEPFYTRIYVNLMARFEFITDYGLAAWEEIEPLLFVLLNRRLLATAGSN